MVGELMRWRSVVRNGRVLISEASEESEALGSSPGLHVFGKEEILFISTVDPRVNHRC